MGGHVVLCLHSWIKAVNFFAAQLNCCSASPTATQLELTLF